MNKEDFEWETEVQKRIIRLLATIFHREGITIAKAQDILGKYVDADFIIDSLLKDKYIMLKMGTTNKYEFTFRGITEYYRVICRGTNITTAVAMSNYVARKSKELSA